MEDAGIWRSLPEWTAEDEAASHGARSMTAPGYIFKLPGQRFGARIDQSFEAVRTRALLGGIMRGQVRSPED